MIAVETELNTRFKSTDWNPNNAMTVVRTIAAPEYDLFRLLKLTISADSTMAKQALFFPVAPSSSALSVGFQPNRRFVVKFPSEENSTDTLLTAAPNAAQKFFQRAENQLSAETEITAQFALKLLRRIKSLAVKICPNELQGRVLALVDAEDGSTTIEWIRNRSRLGFVLDQENESSWFVVLPNGESKSGYLYGKDGLKSLHRLLEEFVSAE